MSEEERKIIDPTSVDGNDIPEYSLNERYTISILDFSRLKDLRSTFWTWLIVTSFLHVFILVTSLIVPFMFTDFLVRIRAYSMDYTVLLFWIGCSIHLILFVVVYFVLRPNTTMNYTYQSERFGPQFANTPDRPLSYTREKSEIKDLLSTSRIFCVVFIIYEILSGIGGVLIINLLYFIPDNTWTRTTLEGPRLIGNPFFDNDALFDYRFDRMSIILSYIFAAIQIILIIRFIWTLIVIIPKINSSPFPDDEQFFVYIDNNTKVVKLSRIKNSTNDTYTSNTESKFKQTSQFQQSSAGSPYYPSYHNPYPPIQQQVFNHFSNNKLSNNNDVIKQQENNNNNLRKLNNKGAVDDLKMSFDVDK